MMQASDDGGHEPAKPLPSGLPGMPPDEFEDEHGDEYDNIAPDSGYHQLPVVGLGGSAGGITALTEFFGCTPAQTGLAYVVVLHLVPDHPSILADVLQRDCPMPVRVAEDGARLQADKVYVIPPGKHLTAADGHLRLSDLEPEHGKRVAVDLFFRSLADSHGPHATAIVLSGAEGDGAMGLKRIKEHGGLTIAQDPGEAEYPSMPQSAIDTGMVDWVLRVADMPARVTAYRQREQRLQLPSETPVTPASPETVVAEREQQLREILLFVRARTGRDFSYYKRATVVRRLARRMQVTGVDDMAGYLNVLRVQQGEAAALVAELLISVTNFFRDREFFEALEPHMARLFEHKRSDQPFRLWVPACATGEEAFSMAMMLLECTRTLESPPMLQVFACDLDADAIQFARAGLYPETIAADVSEERLRRFFVKVPDGYLVRREVREMVLFAVHDVLKDAPFSRLDMLSCRNLLIYLNRSAQQRCMEIFNFAINAGGLLFLGSSETVPESSELFEPVDRKHRIYRQLPAARIGVPTAIGGGDGSAGAAMPQPEEIRQNRVYLPVNAFTTRSDAAFARVATVPARMPPASELHLRLLGRFGPASALIDANYDIVHLSESANPFLQLPQGEPTSNLLRLARPSLRVGLRTALIAAHEQGEPVRVVGGGVELPDGPARVDLHVAPAGDVAPGHYLVLFETHQTLDRDGVGRQTVVASNDAAVEALVQQLEQQLARAGDELQGTIEQYEVSNEELKASNEELQAMNEELRSAGEELESGREELQSVNEELTTLNGEFKSRVDELSRANSDLYNLMNATQIATVFLDRDLRIMRYTPSAVPLFNFINADIGRPISDLKQRLDYPQLVADGQQVLKTLVPIEREMRSDDHWLMARVLPYRTPEDRIAGVVLTLIDITERKSIEGALQASERRLQLLADAVPQIIWTNDRDGRAIYFNRGWYDYSGLPSEDSVGPGWQAIVHPDDLERSVAMWRQAFAAGEVFACEYRLRRADGSYRWFIGRNVPTRDSAGAVDGWFGTATDIDDLKKAEVSLRESQEQLRLIVDNARDYAIFAMDLERRITSWNSGAEAILGYTQDEALGMIADVIFTPEDRAAGATLHEAHTALRDGRAADERWHLRKDDSRFWGSGVMMAMHDGPGRPIGLLKIFRDQTAELRTKQAMEETREQLRAALQETERARDEAETAGKTKDGFLAVLSHELRAPLSPVMLGAQLLARDKTLAPSAQETVAMIERNVRLQSSLIDDLLDVSRITHGKMELTLETLDLHAVVERAVEVAQGDLRAKGQRASVELAAPESTVHGDARRLQQIFWNLLKNASKFTPNGGRVALRTRNDDGWVVVEVSDDGVGFLPEDAERIFAVFEQADRKVTAAYGGLGLGLAIAEASAKAHGGRIRARSEGPGKGSTFTVELPAVQA